MKYLNILQLKPEKVKSFFLQEKNYCTVELPPYFKFDELLEKIDQRYHMDSDFYAKTEQQKNIYPSGYEEVNYKIFSNKDGKYAWRLLEIIHPVLYVDLVNKISKQWNVVQEAFERFQKNKNITCASIPVINQKQQIKTWLKQVEQKSIEFSLEYKYVCDADITDCYGAIYTHSIPWALHTKATAKENRRDMELLGNQIDGLLQGMNYGQTNGIPQGSVLMNFIAEMVLGYIDEELSQKLKELEDYHIIRYRDDYRIFINKSGDGKKIIKELSAILSEMKMRLEDAKTKHSNDIITSAIKVDKMHDIINTRVANNDVKKQLLYIKYLSDQYPNSGILVKKLKEFKEVLSKKSSYQIKDKTLLCIRRNGLEQIKNYKKKSLKKQSIACIGILTDIAVKNPRIYPEFAMIVSDFICRCNINNEKVISLILKKFDGENNTEILHLWLQRIVINVDGINFHDLQSNNDNSQHLINKVEGNFHSYSEKIWNSEEWLNTDFKKIIDENSIIDQDIKNKLECVISSSELSYFFSY